MKRHLFGVAAAVLGTSLVGGVGLQTAAAADPVPTTVTLPLFGAPLTLGITTDVGGALTEVSVDPADNTVAMKLKPHKVVFKSANPANPTDTARIVVKSGHGGQSVSARAGSLGNVSGPGVWSGDIFGDGTTTTVKFTIAAADDGSPDITGITSSDATAVVGDVKYSNGDGHDGHDNQGDSQSARVSVKFTSATGDLSRSLSIRVRVHTGEEHDGAQLSISLGPIKGVAMDAATAAGLHTWSGALCNGSAATIAYTVAEDGTVSDVTATPATAEVRTDGDKISVKFSETERVFIKVRANDGKIKIQAAAMLRCNSGDPKTNVDVTIPTPDSSGDNHSGEFGHGDHKGDQHQGG